MMIASRYGAARLGVVVSAIAGIVRHGPAARNRKLSQILDLPEVFSLPAGPLLWDNECRGTRPQPGLK
jgi:hypothetical protein